MGVLQSSFSDEEIEAQKNKVTKLTQLNPNHYDHQVAWRTFCMTFQLRWESSSVRVRVGGASLEPTLKLRNSCLDIPLGLLFPPVGSQEVRMAQRYWVPWVSWGEERVGSSLEKSQKVVYWDALGITAVTACSCQVLKVEPR